MTSVRAPIAVVGTGLMGHGIAQVFACAGHPVAVHDPVAGALATVHRRVAVNLSRLGLSDEALGCISLHARLEVGGLDLALNIHEQILPFIDCTPRPTADPQGEGRSRRARHEDRPGVPHLD